MAIVSILNRRTTGKHRMVQLARRYSGLSAIVLIAAACFGVMLISVLSVFLGPWLFLLSAIATVAGVIIWHRLEMARLTCLGSRPEIFIKTCEQLEVFYPSSFWREAKHAVQHANAGRREEADAIAEAWTRRKTPIHPEYVQFLINRMDDELDGTVAVMESLSNKDPNWCTHSGMWVDLALNYAELGDWDSALTMLEHTSKFFESAQLKPSGLLAFFGLAGAEVEFEALAAEVKEREFPEFKQDYYRGSCCLARGDAEDAERLLRAAKSKLPENRNRMTLQGMVAHILSNRIERKLTILQNGIQPLENHESIRARLNRVVLKWRGRPVVPVRIRQN